MSGMLAALDVAMLLLGGTGLFEGLERLASSPFPAVLIILGAMAFLLFPIAGLCGAEGIRPRSTQRERVRTEKRS